MICDAIRFLAYDTLCTIRVQSGHSLQNTRAVLETARDIAMRVQQCLNMYDQGSELAQLCQGYRPGAPQTVSPMLFSFLEQNWEICRLSRGAFDPTVGPLVKMWNFLADNPRPPAEKELADALSRVGWRHVHLDAARRAVRFDIPGVQIDPGAGGKGFALDLVAAHLRERGIHNAVLDFGGNLYALGGKTAGTGSEPQPWKIAIRSPHTPDGILGKVELENAGIATSSWYEHCFEKDGRVYHHLLNPATGKPMESRVKSVSVISSRGAYTDLLSTALFVLGEREGGVLVEELRRHSGEEIGYVMALDNGPVIVSDGLSFEEEPMAPGGSGRRITQKACRLE